MRKLGNALPPAIVAVMLLLAATAAEGQTIESLSTGISRSERSVAHPEYSLKLIFAEKSGSLLAGIAVTIASGGKEVFRTEDAGPWLFVDLPAGDYLVEAKRADGAGREANVSVGASGQTAVQLSWPTE
ncbi:MAG: hypothetical protein AB1568_03795 [Thermodesulfobacteriota bacterium]